MEANSSSETSADYQFNGIQGIIPNKRKLLSCWCLIKHYVKNTSGAVEISTHILNFSITRESSASRPGRFIPRERLRYPVGRGLSGLQ
jgi:hypothetical protein